MPEETKLDAAQGEMSHEEEMEFLKEDESEEKPKESKEPKIVERLEGTEPEEVETEKTEEEKEEPEELEASEYVTKRPTWSEINKEFPEFFKKFPQLKHVIGREMAYSEVFPTVEDAQEAQEDSEAFTTLNDHFLKGDIKEISALMKETDEKAYNRFVDDFLPSLYSSDSTAFYRITAPIVQNLFNQIYIAAKGKNENLENAVRVIADHVFGDENIIEKPAQVTQQRNDDADNERAKFQRERLTSARKDVETSILSDLKDSIFNDFVSQFPDEKIPQGMEEFISDAVESAVSKIDKVMSSDRSYMNMINSLWRRAFNSQFTGDWKDRIIDAYLSRAQELIPDQRRKIMPFIPKKSSTSNGRKVTSGTPVNSSAKSNPSSKEIDWRRTSDRDFLDDKVTLRSN